MEFHYYIVKMGEELWESNHDISFMHVNSEMLSHMQTDMEYVHEYTDHIKKSYTLALEPCI